MAKKDNMTNCPNHTECPECKNSINIECQNYDWSDVTDHTSVAPRFGSDQELDELLEELEKNGKF